MTAPLALPSLTWGPTDAPRRALLIHGLGSSGALMWRLGAALGEAGWAASAVDLRGHGSAPRALDYTIDAFAADVSATTPPHGGPWDLVIGHSLGGAAAVVASAGQPGWARRLVLIDPGIVVLGADAEAVRVSQEQAFADNRAELVRAEHPEWHPQDIELKVDAVARASRWAVDQVAVQNPDWDVRDACARVTVPTHVIGADPEVYSLFTAISRPACSRRIPGSRCRSSRAPGTHRTVTSPTRPSGSCSAYSAADFARSGRRESSPRSVPGGGTIEACPTSTPPPTCPTT